MTVGPQEPGAAPSLPEGLRSRVLEAAWQARAAGRAVPEVEEISPAEAFGRVVDAFDGTLRELSEADWHRLALRGLDVQQLVGHLIGVETDVRRCLAGSEAVADASHVASTQAAAIRQTGRPPDRTRADWRRAAEETLDMVQADADGDTPLALHGLRITLGTLLIVRAFELWTHDNDIRRATGRPPVTPEDSVLRLMTGLAARLLPRAVARVGFVEPTLVHLVLTGSGGGTWDVVVGDDQANAATVGIVAPAVGFCELVANRLSPADLAPHVTGDPERAAEILAAASALALD